MGRLGPDLIFPLLEELEAYPLTIQSLLGREGSAQEAVCGSFRLLPCPLPSPESSLGKAQRPDSLVHLPCLRPRLCHSWVWSGSGAQGHTKHMSVPTWSDWSFSRTSLGWGLHWDRPTGVGALEAEDRGAKERRG